MRCLLGCWYQGVEVACKRGIDVSRQNDYRLGICRSQNLSNVGFRGSGRICTVRTPSQPIKFHVYRRALASVRCRETSGFRDD